ncbi:MAG: hypothetical protein IKS11_03555 [Lachnospiraceae bacterium]|nr:hypothetical protein [Lachnospiraceae bacterium]
MRKERTAKNRKKRSMFKQAAMVLLVMCMALNFDGCGSSGNGTDPGNAQVTEGPAKPEETPGAQESPDPQDTRGSQKTEEEDLTGLVNEKILFSHSFEKDENDSLKTDVLMGSAGLAKAGTTLCLDDDRTMFVDKTKLSGSADNGNESKDKLFDDKTNTKFLTFITPTEEKPVEVGFAMKSACRITNYIIA